MQVTDIPENKLNSPQEEQWSTSYLVDNLKQHLARIELSKSKVQTDVLDTLNGKYNTYFCLISNRHYVNQAFHYLKIGAQTGTRISN